MAHYAIGDLHGCYDELMALLAKIQFEHGKDTLWLVGDIINRGPKSWACLQFVRKHESSVQMVLGNHDLHLLAIMYGASQNKRSDTVNEIINHLEAKKIRDWLRSQPLLVNNGEKVLVHAGVWADWTIKEAISLAQEVEEYLHGSQAAFFFEHMYGNYPNQWQNDLKEMARLRVITNIFTRMRIINKDKTLNYEFKSCYEDIPQSAYAWFDAPHRQNLTHQIIFGHWSALGLHQDKNVLALDTGALWGGKLTAANLDTGEITQVNSKNYKKIK